jgi:hypothetical protein
MGDDWRDAVDSATLQLERFGVEDSNPFAEE